MPEMNDFDKRLDSMREPEDALFRDALIGVCDAAYMCKLWFESYGLAATAADVVALTRLVMEREAALKAADDDGL
jgi:hypothetical protein